jgi:hypothetical protein
VSCSPTPATRGFRSTISSCGEGDIDKVLPKIIAAEPPSSPEDERLRNLEPDEPLYRLACAHMRQ